MRDCSPPLPYPARRHTGLSISVEDVTGPKAEVVINVDRHTN
jgi:hypothetical protein